GEIGINFGYQPHDRLRIGAQILARQLGSAGEYDPDLDWAFADYQLNDWVSVKFGKFFVPWGLYNEGRDVDILRNSILPNQAVYAEDFRDISLMKGLELHGTIELSENNSVDYRIAKGNTDFSEKSPLLLDTRITLDALYSAGISANTGGLVNVANPITSLDMNINGFLAYGFVWNTWIEGLRLGHTSMEPDIDINAQIPAALGGSQYTLYDFTKNLVVNSLEYTKDEWTYAYEQLSYSIDTVTSQGRAPAFKAQTYYHQVTYRLNERYEFGVMKSNAYLNTLKGKTALDNYLNDLAFTVRVDMAEDWVLKLEYHDMKGLDSLRTSLNPGLTATANQGKDWDMLMAKVTYSF
ncbi:OprO/OprP family phosphate-selective porin, partial [bacterium]|nr:OprO/OprP family phosphate-selective porin [bacterium]